MASQAPIMMAEAEWLDRHMSLLEPVADVTEMRKPRLLRARRQASHPLTRQMKLRRLIE